MQYLRKAAPLAVWAAVLGQAMEISSHALAADGLYSQEFKQTANYDILGRAPRTCPLSVTSTLAITYMALKMASTNHSKLLYLMQCPSLLVGLLFAHSGYPWTTEDALNCDVEEGYGSGALNPEASGQRTTASGNGTVPGTAVYYTMSIVPQLPPWIKL